MYNCDGCYYEERLPQEACNVCRRDENGKMTGYVDGNSYAEGKKSAEQDMETLREKENLQQLLIEELRAATQKHLEERDDYAAQCDALIEQLKRMQQEKEKFESLLEKERAQGSYYKQWMEDERRCRELADAKLEMVRLIFGGGGNG